MRRQVMVLVGRVYVEEARARRATPSIILLRAQPILEALGQAEILRLSGAVAAKPYARVFVIGEAARRARILALEKNVTITDIVRAAYALYLGVNVEERGEQRERTR